MSDSPAHQPPLIPSSSSEQPPETQDPSTAEVAEGTSGMRMAGEPKSADSTKISASGDSPAHQPPLFPSSASAGSTGLVAASAAGSAQGAGKQASGGASASLGIPAAALQAGDLLDIRGELLAMMTKPGWKTSELWFLLAAAAAAQWAVHAHLVNGDLTELLTYAAGLIYTYFRLTHKADVMGQVASDFADHAPGTVIDVEAEVARVLPALLAESNVTAVAQGAVK